MLTFVSCWRSVDTADENLKGKLVRENAYANSASLLAEEKKKAGDDFPESAESIFARRRVQAIAASPELWAAACARAAKAAKASIDAAANSAAPANKPNAL